MTIWEVLAAFRLTIRNIEIASSAHIDGGIPCLSGRTAAYRTVILKDPDFLHGFTNDLWLGKYHLNSGDDKFLTRWMVSHGWNTYVQVCKEAELLSTMKPNWRFLKQVLRWTRNTWRSDFRSIFTERYIWTKHPYVAYTMIDKFVNPLTLLVGPVLVIYLIVKSTHDTTDGGYHLPAWYVLSLPLSTLTKECQECHLFRQPISRSKHVWYTDGRLVRSLAHDHPYLQTSAPSLVPALAYYLCTRLDPLWLLLVSRHGLFHRHSTDKTHSAIMKLYALFTLHETGWGTRAGIGDRASQSTFQAIVKMLKRSTAATATAATEKRGNVSFPGPMHGEARHGVYDVEMNGVTRKE